MAINYKIWKALEPEQVETIKSLVSVGNWGTALNSFQKDANRKIATNYEYDPKNPNFASVRKIVYDSLDRSPEFYNFCFPTTSSEILVSKTCVGEYLNIHEDAPINGNFSTTMFLSEPSSYDGGELCLYIDGKEEKIKLDAGYAITYSTGLLHRVSTVERGQRLAIAFWSKSFLTDRLHRELLNDLYELSKKLPLDTDVHSDFESYLNSPRNMVNQIINKILRMYDI